MVSAVVLSEFAHLAVSAAVEFVGITRLVIANAIVYQIHYRLRRSTPIRLGDISDRDPRDTVRFYKLVKLLVLVLLFRRNLFTGAVYELGRTTNANGRQV